MRLWGLEGKSAGFGAESRGCPDTRTFEKMQYRAVMRPVFKLMKPEVGESVRWVA